MQLQTGDCDDTVLSTQCNSEPIELPLNNQSPALATDKWLYAMLPRGSVYVSCYPLFCLDAADSDLHPDHVDRFHRASREATLSIWQSDGLHALVEAQRRWDEIE